MRHEIQRTREGYSTKLKISVPRILCKIPRRNPRRHAQCCYPIKSGFKIGIGNVDGIVVPNATLDSVAAPDAKVDDVIASPPPNILPNVGVPKLAPDCECPDKENKGALVERQGGNENMFADESVLPNNPPTHGGVIGGDVRPTVNAPFDG